jgi:Flp pilus assembly protein TadG
VFNRSLRRASDRRREAEEGSAAVEFGFVAPVLLASLFAILYIGKMYLDTQTLQTAVESAGRLIVTNSSVTQDQLKTAIQNSIGVIGNPTITVSYTTTTIGGQSVGHLTATMTRSYAVPLITTYNMTYTAETYIPPSAYTGS